MAKVVDLENSTKFWLKWLKLVQKSVILAKL